MRIALALLIILGSLSVGASEFDHIVKALAGQSNAIEQFASASKYFKGEGVPQNYKEAVRLYRASAEQGFAKAQFNLGVMHYNGEGTPQDYKKAHKWWNLAAANGHEEAKVYRDKVAEMMTTADISEAQQMARDWMKAHPKGFNSS